MEVAFRRRLLGEKFAHDAGERFRLVQGHLVAGVGDLHEPAVGQAPDHLFGDFARKHFTLFGAEDEDGAADVFEAFPEVWDFDKGGPAGGLVDLGVEAEDEVPGGFVEHERGHELAAEEFARGAGIHPGEVFEGGRLCLEAGRFACFAGGFADAARARFGHLRAHIGEDEVLEAVAVVARVGHGHAAADTVGDEVEGFEVQFFDEAAQVHGEGPDEVATGRVLAFAVATQVGRVDSEAGDEGACHALPVAGVVHEPVEEDDGVGLRLAPADVVVAEPVDSEVAILAMEGGGGRVLGRHRGSIEDGGMDAPVAWVQGAGSFRKAEKYVASEGLALYFRYAVFIFDLQLANYRNYPRSRITLDRGLNLFVGDNAQGKSNLLEAIYLLSTLRSSRASSDADLVRRDILPSEFPVARLAAQVERSAGNLLLEVAVVGRTTDTSHRAGKRVRVNGVPRRASDAVGQLAAVLFTTLDIEIVAGPPLLRRRYLDMMISQVDRGYLRAMQRYARVLQQRNSLLKRIQQREANAGELGFWDQELSHAGGTIMQARGDALGHLALQAEQQMDRLSDGVEAITLTYKPALGGLDENDCPIDETEWASRMLRALANLRGREIGAGATLVGPHRDDIVVEIDGLPADSFASRAQQRTAALSMRLAEASYLRRALGDDPVVLLDDVLSELDARRRKGVLEFFDTFQQTIVTTADPDRVRDMMTRAAGRFFVSNGTITRFEGE